MTRRAMISAARFAGLWLGLALATIAAPMGAVHFICNMGVCQ